MFLAGIPVRDALVLGLARLVDDPELASRLEAVLLKEHTWRRSEGL